MKRPKKLKAGTYEVSVTITQTIDVDPDDSYYGEDELLAECRRRGEMVDWDVREQ